MRGNMNSAGCEGENGTSEKRIGPEFAMDESDKRLADIKSRKVIASCSETVWMASRPATPTPSRTKR